MQTKAKHDHLDVSFSEVYQINHAGQSYRLEQWDSYQTDPGQQIVQTSQLVATGDGRDTYIGIEGIIGSAGPSEEEAVVGAPASSPPWSTRKVTCLSGSLTTTSAGSASVPMARS